MSMRRKFVAKTLITSLIASTLLGLAQQAQAQQHDRTTFYDAEDNRRRKCC